MIILKIHALIPNEIEDFDKFKTEMGPLLKFINSAANGKKFSNAFETKRTRWENLSSEAIDLLNICLDAKLEIKRDLEKGVGNVCKGLEEFWEMVREDVEKRGLEEGRAAFAALIYLLKTQYFRRIFSVNFIKTLFPKKSRFGIRFPANI